MVEWSKTWDLSYINFPITQVARVRTPLLSSFFFSIHVVCIPKKCATYENKPKPDARKRVKSKYKIKKSKCYEESRRIVTSADSPSSPSIELVREKPALD